MRRGVESAHAAGYRAILMAIDSSSAAFEDVLDFVHPDGVMHSEAFGGLIDRAAREAGIRARLPYRTDAPHERPFPLEEDPGHMRLMTTRLTVQVQGISLELRERLTACIARMGYVRSEPVVLHLHEDGSMHEGDEDRDPERVAV